MRLAHGDLVLSTQGRGFWILDNLSAIRQLPAPGAATLGSRLYKPATAVRINAGADAGPDPAAGPEYPLPGAQIDYYIAPSGRNTPVTLAIMDKAGRVVRSFTSGGKGRGDEAAGGDEEGGYRPVYPATLDASPGMHRFTWDLRYSGETQPVASTAGKEAPHFPDGPMAAPGSYVVRMSFGGVSKRQPLTIVEDPRILASGVTDSDLEALFEHNMRVLKLVNDTNADVARLTAALKDNPGSAKQKALQAVADRLITSKIRYSQPALQTHVIYLYDETNNSDQPPGEDAVQRYQELRRQVDTVTAELDALLGPARPKR
jgi:hypothetical protein